jgi:hypothetical protein
VDIVNDIQEFIADFVLLVERYCGEKGGSSEALGN